MKAKLFAGCVLCAVLGACTTVQNTTSKALDAVGDEADASYNGVRDLLDVPHQKQPKGKAQPRYCYRTFEDVVCYSNPIPGEEERLVGFQQPSGNTGYTLPPGAKVLNGDTAMTLPPIKSVTVPPPPPVMGNNGQLKEIIFDPAELEPKQLVPEKPQ